MVGVDTNIIIRYILRDDKNQASQADKVFDNMNKPASLLINQIVLVEIIWVLKRLYKYSKNDLLKILGIIIPKGIFFSIFILNNIIFIKTLK